MKKNPLGNTLVEALGTLRFDNAAQKVKIIADCKVIWNGDSNELYRYMQEEKVATTYMVAAVDNVVRATGFEPLTLYITPYKEA